MQRWERFRPEFDELGVRVVTISADTVEETAAMKSKLGLGMTMLSDASLAVIDLYNLRHDKGIAATPGKRGVFRPLAIPTAILVDEAGVVRWMDQTDDYRIRSDAGRILTAVKQALDARSASTAMSDRESGQQ